MTNGKTLMLAAVAALSLGMGAAQAQNLTINNGAAGYGFGQNRPAVAPVNRGSDLVPSGSSDISPVRSGATHDTAPVLFGGDGSGG